MATKRKAAYDHVSRDQLVILGCNSSSAHCRAGGAIRSVLRSYTAQRPSSGSLPPVGRQLYRFSRTGTRCLYRAPSGVLMASDELALLVASYWYVSAGSLRLLLAGTLSFADAVEQVRRFFVVPGLAHIHVTTGKGKHPAGSSWTIGEDQVEELSGRSGFVRSPKMLDQGASRDGNPLQCLVRLIRTQNVLARVSRLEDGREITLSPSQFIQYKNGGNLPKARTGKSKTGA